MKVQFGRAAPPVSEAGVSLLVHGGAWDIPAGEHAAHLAGLKKAIAHGRARLLEGAAAVDAAATTVAVLESDGAFDAGCGAVLNRDGEVELDAGIMCGDTLAYGAVAVARGVPNPVLVAHRILVQEDPSFRILAADGARRFAAAQGFPLVPNEALACERERRRYREILAESERFHTSHPFLPADARVPRGTVGCVALDLQGRLAAATSTGGTPFRPAGRVGDTPLPGCGYYAGRGAAASATGWGEAIAAVLLSGRAVDRVSRGAPHEQVLRGVLGEMHERIASVDENGATGGLILLDRAGQGAWAYTTPRMARGGWSEGGDAWVMV